MKQLKFIVFLTVFLLFVQNVHADPFQEEIQEEIEMHPDEISDSNKRRIETGELRPLTQLEETNKKIFDLVIEHLPENASITDYYYSITVAVTAPLLSIGQRHIVIKDGYVNVLDFESRQIAGILHDGQIIHIQYGIWYYQSLFNRYSHYWGNPTGRNFTLFFDINHEFIERRFWR